MKKKRGKNITIKISFSNRWLYTLIIIGILAIIGVGIYAFGTSDPSTFGHSINEIQRCAEGEALKTSGGVWTCVPSASLPSCSAEQYLKFNGVNWICEHGIKSNNVSLKIKTIEIGDWNMDTTWTKTVSTGIADWKSVRSIYALIRRDDELSYNPIHWYGGDGTVAGTALTTPDGIYLSRRPTGAFDNANFDQTSFNRGWITIIYEE